MFRIFGKFFLVYDVIMLSLRIFPSRNKAVMVKVKEPFTKQNNDAIKQHNEYFVQDVEYPRQSHWVDK